jgi:hypothetical protein
MTNYVDRIANDIASRVTQDKTPDGDVGMLFRIYAVLALSKGDAVTARDVHNAWSAWMATQDPEHESLVPFEELPVDTQGEDSPYVEAIRQVARDRGL